ncbi:MAG TPA: nickel pincer cofactor biosynthesis protein LarC [Candidatus Binataceae bacterium]|nr:nickel pincer cofactor biosynthesis protein LarC [Candidatus Binataceae bacterium]
MMKTAYFDAFSGLSGDMIVGSMLDAGADFDTLESAIGSLRLQGYRLSTRRKSVSGIEALKFDVEVLEPQPERHLSEIRAMIENAGLARAVTLGALKIFEALAEAEAKVHRTSPEQVHFHEVGAVDSIIDIVGAAWGFDQLGVESVIVSPLPVGTGFAKSRHGVIPVPAPATAELLAGFPVRLNDGASEMVTPTGAAILKAFARPAPAVIPFDIERIGYGAGSKNFADRPNVLRLMLGRALDAFESDQMIEISANIDDLNPQVYDHLSGRLFDAGARDVTITPTIMKKGRPGVILAVLAEPAMRERMAQLIFAETSTIGLRSYPVARLKLPRKTLTVETRFGTIRVKVSGGDTEPLTIAPEYDDCHRAALEHGMPLKTVIEESRAAAAQAVKL